MAQSQLTEQISKHSLLNIFREGSGRIRNMGISAREGEGRHSLRGFNVLLQTLLRYVNFLLNYEHAVV